MNRKHNAAGYWRMALGSEIEQIQKTIRDKIEAPSSVLEKGTALFTAQTFMLDWRARTDPDDMVYETFKETVEENIPSKLKNREWYVKLVNYLRGTTKRTGFQYEAFNEAQFVLAYLLKFYNPVEEPTIETVLEFIDDFPPSDPEMPRGFNAMRLAWEKKENERLQEEEEKIKKQQEREDAGQARAAGFLKPDGEPDVEAWRSHEQAKYREAQQADIRERLNREISEILPQLLNEGSTVVDQPECDGGHYFWHQDDGHWHRLNDSIRDRMILRGGRSASAR